MSTSQSRRNAMGVILLAGSLAALLWTSSAIISWERIYTFVSGVCSLCGELGPDYWDSISRIGSSRRRPEPAVVKIIENEHGVDSSSNFWPHPAPTQGLQAYDLHSKSITKIAGRYFRDRSILFQRIGVFWTPRLRRRLSANALAGILDHCLHSGVGKLITIARILLSFPSLELIDHSIE